MGLVPLYSPSTRYVFFCINIKEPVLALITLNGFILKTTHQKADSGELSSLLIQPNLREHFCVETGKACSLSCCSPCFGVEAKLIATEFEVQGHRLPRCLAQLLSLYNLSVLFQQTGSPLKLAQDLAVMCLL